MSDATPLTPEQEAALRLIAAVWREEPTSAIDFGYAELAIRLLLATLDAARAAPQGDERLREAAANLATHGIRRTCHITADNDHPCTVCGAPFNADATLAAASDWRDRLPERHVGGGQDEVDRHTGRPLPEPASQGDERLREAASEAAQYGSTLASLLTVLPGECQQVGDICVVHNAEWSTRNGADLGHCEWIEARTEIVPEWRSAERALRAALATPAASSEAAPTTTTTRSLREALRSLPLGVYEGANRYDTDDMHVLHLWGRGESFDIQVRRLVRRMVNPPGPPDPPVRRHPRPYA